MIQIVFKLEEVSSRPPLPKAATKDNPTHGIAVETSRSGGAVARALTLGVSSCQEKNDHFTCKKAFHLLLIGAI
jgi:hypothetical protein